MQFKQATKTESYLRMAISAPSGGGKTYTALTLAGAIANGGKVAVIDTERGSASKYADIFTFDVVELGIDPRDTTPFHPDRYIEAITAAVQAGYKVLVIDSLSHAWNAKGGVLEVVDNIAAQMKTSNTFSAWRKGTPLQQKLVDAILAAPIHIIATMRAKQEYVQDKDERTGKTVVRKVGMAPVQRDSMEYEFDIFAEMDMDNNLIIQKTRCPILTGQVVSKPGPEAAAPIIEWLHGEKRVEALPTEAPKPVPAVQAGPVKPKPANPKPLPSSNGTAPVNPWHLMQDLGWSADDAATELARYTKADGKPVTSFRDLTPDQNKDLIDHLNAARAKQMQGIEEEMARLEQGDSMKDFEETMGATKAA